MQLLERPAARDELTRQMIEQFRVSRSFASQSEIAGRSHQTGSEVVHPDAIDDDSRGERVVGTGNRPREFQPSAAVLKRLPLAASQRGQELSRRDLTGMAGVAANENVRVRRRPRVFQRHRVRSRSRRADPIGHQSLLRMKLLLRRGIDDR